MNGSTNDQPPRARERIGRGAGDVGLFLAAAAITGRALFPSEDADSGSGLELLLLELGCGVCWTLARWLEPRAAPARLAARSWCVLLGWLWISALAAAYRFPAVILAWEWTGVGLVYLFLSQVAGAALRRAVAALLIGLVAGQSLLAWWQVEVTFPELRQMYRRHDPTLVKAMQDELGVAPNSPEAISLQSRLLHSTEPYGTFGLPNSLAGFLVLGLPAVAAALGKRGSGRLPRLTAAAALTLVTSALVLTKSRSAWLAIAASGVASAWWLGWPVLRGHRRMLAATLALLAVLVAAMAAAGLLDRLVLTESFKSLSYRGEWWRASFGILADRPCVGVGLGNFADHYLRHKLPFSSEEIRDPHNFLMELWCTAGLPALALYLAALAGAIGAAGRAVRIAENAAPPGEAPGGIEHDRRLPRAWIAGAAGGFTLAALVKLGLGEALGQTLQGDLAAFFAFGSWPTLICLAIGLTGGAFLSRMLPDRSIPAALVIGAVALHLNWLAAGSTSYPALLLPCWAALANRPGPPPARSGSTWLDALVWLLAIGVLGCFLGTLLLPALGREQIHRLLRSIQQPASDRLVEGYRAAAECLPADQDGWLRLALLHAGRMRLTGIADPRHEYVQAVAAFRRVLLLAPERSSTFQLLGRLRAQAAELGLDPAARQQATAAFGRMVDCYPHSAARRWELATALLAAGATDRAADEFRKALWLDQTPHLDKRLTPAQRTIAKLYAGN